MKKLLMAFVAVWFLAGLPAWADSYQFDTKDGKYTYTYPYYVVSVPASAEGTLSADDYPIIEVTSSEDPGTAIAYATFAAKTAGTFFKTGLGQLNISAALGNWTGTIHVMEGTLRATCTGALGKVASAAVGDATFVHDGATLYMFNETAGSSAEKKRIVFEGVGADGNGALQANQSVDTATGWPLGTQPTLSDDAVLGIRRSGLVLNQSWSPGTTLHLNGHTAKVVGGTYQLNHATVEAGNLVFDNSTFLIKGTQPIFKDGAENTVTFNNGSKIAIDGIDGSKTGWTLVANNVAYAYANSSGANDDTTSRCWVGPVILNGDIPLWTDKNSEAKFGFTGYVSGRGGFPAYTSGGKNYSFHLACPTNSFKGPVGINSGWLNLHANGALPVDCAGLTMKNSTLRLYGTETYRLPAAVMEVGNGSQKVTGRLDGADAASCDGSFVSLTKKGTGTLVLATSVGADRLVLAGGGIEISDFGSQAKVPKFGLVDVESAATISVAGGYALSVTNGLSLREGTVSASTPALSVTGAVGFSEGSTFIVWGDIPAAGTYRILTTTEGITGLPVSKRAGVTLSLGEDDKTLLLTSTGVDAGDFQSPITVTEPMTIFGTHTWTIAKQESIVFDNSLQGVFGTINVNAERVTADADLGVLEFRGTNIVDGAIIVTSALVKVSGLLGTTDHADLGAAAKNGASTLTIDGFINDVNTRSYLQLTDAVIEKPVWLRHYQWSVIISSLSSTNVLKGNVYIDQPVTAFNLQSESELSFEGGLTCNWTLHSQGGGMLRIREKPISVTSAAGFSFRDSSVSLETPGNKFSYLCAGYDADGKAIQPKLIFGCDDAIDRSSTAVLLVGYLWNGTTAKYYPLAADKGAFATADLGSTVQRVNRLGGSIRSQVRGDAGARIEIFNQTAASYLDEANLLFASELVGDVSLAMCGTGVFTLTGRTFETTGSLSVTNGTVKIAEDAVWKGTGDVVIAGTGRLVTTASNQFDKRRTNIRFADSGVLSIPAGMSQAVYSCWVGSEKIAEGTYTRANAPAALKPHLEENGGTLQVRGTPGLILVFR